MLFLFKAPWFQKSFIFFLQKRLPEPHSPRKYLGCRDASAFNGGKIVVFVKVITTGKEFELAHVCSPQKLRHYEKNYRI